MSGVLPKVSDDDIDWVGDLLGLTGLDQPRRDFLKSGATLDVSACPGSGKTTLVVAKLAILARKWSHPTRGVCVLSHTNVARQEIQDRLGATAVGARLLSYPHYIDTIHSFTNRFLALPALAARGVASPTVDNEIAETVRRRVLPNQESRSLDQYLQRRGASIDAITFDAIDLTPTLGAGAFPTRPHTDTHKRAKRIVETSVVRGFLKYEEMFVFAKALLNEYPAAAEGIAHRFPLVLIDEMQDTSERQASLLSRVFNRAGEGCVVQRVGDPNQQIFKSGPETNRCDPFPDAERNMTIPSSRRFGERIAQIADAFAVSAIENGGLVGLGPFHHEDEAVKAKPIAIIFPNEDCSGVLRAFGEHVAQSLSDDLLTAGEVVAVGEVHVDAEDTDPTDPHFPKTIPHYWPPYERASTKRKYYPADLIGYFREARRMARTDAEARNAVALLADGIARYADLIGEKHSRLQAANKHRVIRALLMEHDPSLACTYAGLIDEALWGDTRFGEESWAAKRASLEMVGGVLSTNTDHANGERFLNWSAETVAAEPKNSDGTDDPNVFLYDNGERSVSIRLSSIHGVKGQSHAATLLLSTFLYEHSSEKIFPFLVGSDRPVPLPARLEDRFRRTFVALTRASHLVGVALRASSVGYGNDRAAAAEALKRAGWHVVEI